MTQYTDSEKAAFHALMNDKRLRAARYSRRNRKPDWDMLPRTTRATIRRDYRDILFAARKGRIEMDC